MKKTLSKQIKFLSLIMTLMITSFVLCGCVQPTSTNGTNSSDNSEASDKKISVSESVRDADLENQHAGLTFYRKYVDDIPVIEIFIDDGVKKPAMFVLHGYSGNMYINVDLAVEYARNGYYTIVFDAYGHGERAGAPLKSFPEVMDMYPYEIEKIVTTMKDNPQADVYNMGMIGISMGACAIYKYCTFAEIKPKAIAPLVGTPYYEQFMDTELSRMVYDGGTGNHDTVLTQEQLNMILAESSPYQDYLALNDIAIQMHQGETDTMVTSQGAEMLYHDLKGIGAENVELKVYEGMWHYPIYDECFDNAMAFLDKHLK